jgi:PAS domain S-box-containing protein
MKEKHPPKGQLPGGLKKAFDQVDEASVLFDNFLKIASRHTEMIPLLKKFTAEVRNVTGCAAVGLRLLDERGNIHFKACEGFCKELYESESSFSVDSGQCMCTNVIKGLANPARPYYTMGGSFLSADASRFFATSSKDERNQMCSLCGGFGYESVALVPIRRADRILGLIHVADPRKGMVSPEMVKMLESVAIQLGMAIQWVRSGEMLKKAHEKLERRVEERTAKLKKANKKLKLEIKERKRLEAARRESEERFGLLVETMNEGLAAQDENGLITYVNEKACELTNYSREELIGHPVTDFLDEGNRRIVKEQMANRRRGLDKAYQVPWTRNDGQEIFVIVSPRAFFDADNHFKGSFAVITDITELKRKEKALKESERILRDLSSKLLTAQEDERRRIAGELHDSIGQTLVAIRLSLDKKLQQMGTEVAPPGVSIEQVRALVHNAIEEVQNIQTDLQPSILVNLGILASINRFCRDFQTVHSAIRIEKHINIEEEEVPELLKTVTYRVLQEAMSNAAKHSRADLVELSFGKAEDSIELVIKDNGQGFEVDEAFTAGKGTTGFGIPSMRRRTELSGGVFWIESVRSRGTTVRVTWKR